MFEEQHDNDIFKVPDGYFENLPGVINERVVAATAVRRRFIKSVYAYAAAAVLILLVLVRLNRPAMTAQDAETILASIETEELINYLEESDISVEDVLSEAADEIFNAEADEQIPADVMEELIPGSETDTL
ncbi:MAG TPA: hypothetical protein VEB86_18260 [Chryseosolibacter sp.]|nr:hypothetical protein [Chryseosolibacter sp.]